MNNTDLLALAALAGGALAFKKKADKDYAELPEQKELAARQAKKREALDTFVAENRKASPEELSAARRKAASEELNPEGRIGGRRSSLVSGSGEPVTTRTGFAYTEDYPSTKLKKGGKVKSASSRADGIAQRGKTRGKMR
jgi:hypothetical protein